jgi:hypothetical protein
MMQAATEKTAAKLAAVRRGVMARREVTDQREDTAASESFTSAIQTLLFRISSHHRSQRML